MSLTMSQSFLPVFITGLNALLGLLENAAEFVAAKKIDVSVLLQTRLAADQVPLIPKAPRPDSRRVSSGLLL